MRVQTSVTFFILAVLLAPVGWASTPSMGLEQVVSAEDFDEYLPQVAYNSNHDEYFVVWHQYSPLQGRWVMGKRVATDGTTIAEYTIAFDDNPARDNAQPSVAYDPAGDLYLVAWARDFFGDDSDWDVFGRIVPWNGPSAGQTQFPICGYSSKQWNPKVDFAGTQNEFMVTWWNEGTGGVHSYVSAQRVTPSGALAGGAITVTSSPSEERVGPDIAYNQARNEYLIVYQRMDDVLGNIYGVRLTATGSILGGGDFAIAAWPDAETAPRVAASRVADEWAVTWQSDIPGLMKEVYARRIWVDGAGTVQSATPVYIAGDSIDQRNPDIAAYSGNNEYLIAWEQQYSNSSGAFGITARTLDTGNALGATFDPRVVYTGETGVCSRPALAASPTGWLVAWEHDRNDTPNYQDIHARTIYGPIFTDGFESGNLLAWDDASP